MCICRPAVWSASAELPQAFGVSVLHRLFRVSLLFDEFSRLLLRQGKRPEIPVLLNVPTCTDIEFHRIIIDLLGRQPGLELAGSPHSVAVAVKQKPEVVITRFEIEKVSPALRSPAAAHHLSASVEQLDDCSSVCPVPAH